MSKKKLSREIIQSTTNDYPIIAEIKKPTNNIFDNDEVVEFSNVIDFPRGEYGFHHFIHNNKNKMSILSDFEN